MKRIRHNVDRLNMDVKRRPYRSAARVEQAQQTRRRIVAAASRLFVQRGYASTSVADIAAEAGVVSRTIYFDFPNKRALLDQAIGVAIGGDDAPVMLRDRNWFRQTVEAPGAAASADPELAERRDRGHENRRADLRRVATAIASKTGADVDYVTDLLYTLGSSAVYALYVFQCGWSPKRYEMWLREALEAAILK